jgi:alkyl sulfatase BDS1-like metallo-beta-lactamase superfamily hydrolase
MGGPDAVLEKARGMLAAGDLRFTATEELRGPIAAAPPDLASPQVLGALTIEQLFDSIGIRIDGLRAAGADVCIDWVFTDLNRTYARNSRTERSSTPTPGMAVASPG